MADSASYGGFWIRSLAYAADMAILTLALLLLAVPFAFMGGAGAALFGVIAGFGPFAYFVWLTASDRQATFGKQLCGLKVRHAASGEGISLLRSLARELAKIISAAILAIGFLMIAFTGRKQGLHDLLASTEVVREGTARIGLALFVAIGGVVVPFIVIPLMFGALFAGLMAMMMGTMMGEAERGRVKPVPQIEQKAAPRAQAPAAQPAPQAAAAAPTAPAAKPAAAGGADDPETVYRKFHQAMLESDFEGMRKWGTKAKGDALAATPAAERKIMDAFTAKLTPKTYKVLGTEISADGKTAIVRLSAEQTVKGKTETYHGSGTLFKEAGEWKVDESSWGGEQPPAPAPQSAAAKPAAVEPAKPAAAELPKPVAASAPAVKQAQPAPAAKPRAAPSRSAPAAAPLSGPVLQQGKPPCVYQPVMTDEEIARCR
jgi:uncharacterized RDD family membrane protein YckC